MKNQIQIDKRAYDSRQRKRIEEVLDRCNVSIETDLDWFPDLVIHPSEHRKFIGSLITPKSASEKYGLVSQLNPVVKLERDELLGKTFTLSYSWDNTKLIWDSSWVNPTLNIYMPTKSNKGDLYRVSFKLDIPAEKLLGVNFRQTS